MKAARLFRTGHASDLERERQSADRLIGAVTRMNKNHPVFALEYLSDQNCAPGRIIIEDRDFSSWDVPILPNLIDPVPNNSIRVRIGRVERRELFPVTGLIEPEQ